MKKITNKKILHSIEYVLLVIVLLATLIAIAQQLLLMVGSGMVTLSDLLLLFIYLEVVAMVGIYYDTHQMPVRYPLYIAIVALARYLILEAKDLSPETLVAVGLTILLITASVFLVRYGHVKYPYIADKNQDESEDKGAK